MPIIVLLVVVAAIGAVAVVLAGRSGGEAEFEPDRPHFALPDGELVAPDVDAIRFSVGVRGYRMDQVDAVLDRLARELAERDARIELLEGAAGDEAVVKAADDARDDARDEAGDEASTGPIDPVPPTSAVAETPADHA